MTTSRTLLHRLRNPADAEAWNSFFEIYAPLLESYARARGLSSSDAEEVRDECLALVTRRMPAFDYDCSRGGFQAWLYTLAHGKIVDHLRRRREPQPDTRDLGTLPDPSPGPDEIWERTWRREHLRFALSEARRRTPPRSFRVFELLLLEGLTVPEVCDRAGLNANQVYKAKSRVLACVREVMSRLGADTEEA